MYQKYITTGSNGEPILYVILLKALYGLLRLGLRFYKKLRGDSENMDFEINPYDLCVANKTINGSQMTVIWYVGDLKISHNESTEVTKFIHDLGEICRNKLTVTSGKVHSYLGIDFGSTTLGRVRLEMILYSK